MQQSLCVQKTMWAIYSYQEREHRIRVSSNKHKFPPYFASMFKKKLAGQGVARVIFPLREFQSACKKKETVLRN